MYTLKKKKFSKYMFYNKFSNMYTSKIFQIFIKYIEIFGLFKIILRNMFNSLTYHKTQPNNNNNFKCRSNIIF